MRYCHQLLMSPTPGILNKYFARSTWATFTFPSLNAAFKISFNHAHNILRLSAVLPNLPFTTSEMKRDFY